MQLLAWTLIWAIAHTPVAVANTEPSATAALSDVSYAGLIAQYDELAHKPNPKLRKSIKGAYHTALGLQVHPYCFELAAQAAKKEGKVYDQKQAEAAIENFINSTTQKIIGAPQSCSQRYPQLNTFFYSWFTRARRTVIVCNPLDSKDLDAAARYIALGYQLAEAPSKAVAGLDIKTSESTYRSYKPTLEFPINTFLKALTDPNDTTLQTTLIHEIFHGTGANNRDDHNDVERISTVGSRKKIEIDSCSDQILDDRISVLSALCSGSTLRFEQNPVENALLRRIERCGANKGCVAVFRDHDRSIDDIGSSKLSPAAAISVCQQIVDQTSCTEWAKGNLNEAIASSPELQEARALVKERLDQIIPKKYAQINVALLEVFPDFVANINGRALSECFNNATIRDSSGNLYPASVRPEKLPDLDIFSRARTGGGSLWPDMLPFVSAVKQRPECADPTLQKRVIDALTSVGRQLELALNSTAFKQLAFSTFRNKPEEIKSLITNYAQNTDGLTSMSTLRDGPENKAFIKLVGASRFNQYLAAFERFHPHSNRFECLALKNRPHRNIELSAQTPEFGDSAKISDHQFNIIQVSTPVVR